MPSGVTRHVNRLTLVLQSIRNHESKRTSLGAIMSAKIAMGMMLTVLASSVLAIVPANAQALKESLVGAWVITEVSDNYLNGEKRDNWGKPVTGQLMFDRNGRFTQTLIGPPVAAMKTDDPRKPDAFIVSFYGTYTVDEQAKTVSTKIEGASYSGRKGTTFTSTVQLSGDKLTLVGSERKDQHGTFKPVIELKRP
jgi:hypothetical protein